MMWARLVESQESDLEAKIRKYAASYYDGNPEISDAEFDSLVNDLEKINPDNKLLHTVGWGYEVNAPATLKGKHRFEILKFEDKVKDSENIKISPSNGILSYKIDGGSVCCYYENGVLSEALTRGDGVTGFKVTEKMKHIVPETLKDSSFTGMVRGEIAMKNSIFHRNYSENSSPRNTAVGILRKNKNSLAELRDLSFVAYTVRGDSSSKLDSKRKVLNWLKQNGFEAVDEIRLSSWDDDSLRKVIQGYSKYPVDGVVATSNFYRKMPDGTFVPDREVAYKTEAEIAETVVTDISWRLTRTGKLFPVAILNPVRLSGATVRKASAFSAKYVKDNGLGIGSKVTIMRSGEVIPDIQEVLTKGKFNIPKVCPFCGTSLDMNGANLFCKNVSCSGRLGERLYHWIYTLVNLKGLGDSILDQISDNLGLESVDDLYQNLNNLENAVSGQVSKNLVSEMISILKKPVSFSRFLLACGIPGIGETASFSLSSKKDFILKDRISSSWKEDILNLSGINKIAKENLISHIDEIRRLSRYVKFEESSVKEKGIVVITGELSVPRKDFIEEIRKFGWRVGSSVTKDTKFLITENPSSNSTKAMKARNLGIPFVSESEFRRKCLKA